MVGLSARHYSANLQHSVGPIVGFEAAEEQERTISLEALGGDQKAQAACPAVRDDPGRAGKDLHSLDILTLVMAARSGADITGLEREYREILRLCRYRALSVVEIAAHMNLLLAVVKVLVSDLIDSRYLIYQSPQSPANRPDIELLQAVLEGVRKL